MHISTSRIWLVLTMSALISGLSVSYARQGDAIDAEHTKWIARVLHTIQTVKPGMTRSDLRKVFREEGGLSTRAHRKYVFNGCPFIKVDVDFVFSDRDMASEKPEDKISSISRPYLEYSIMD
jgi:hypothetical protein